MARANRTSRQLAPPTLEGVWGAARLGLPAVLALVFGLGCSGSESGCDPGTDPNCQSNTATIITSDNPDPSIAGQEVTVAFSVEAAQGTPAGLVEVSVEGGGVESCSASVALGECKIRLASAGSKTLRATYLGGGGFEGSSDTEPHQVSKAATRTTLESHDPNPSVVGQQVAVAFSVSAVAPASGNPTGSVTVSDGVDSCTAPVRRGGCNLVLTTAGSKPLTATYLGDASFEGSSDTETQEVQAAETATNIVSHNPNPSVVGQAVTVVFDVSTSPPGGGTPTGSVTVSDGSVSCSASVAEGSCTLVPTSVGLKTLTATYAGNANFKGSSDTESHVVGSASTTVTLTDEPDPSVVGQPVTASFTVSSNDGGTPTGSVTVTVNDGTDASCTAPVSVGSCNIVLTQAGEWTLTATYPGDGNFEPGAVADTHVVNRAATQTQILSDNPDPSAVGQAVTVSYSVTVSPPGAGTPTGNVTVSDGTDSCTAPLAQGSCVLTPTTAGNKNLRATYSGDANFQSSQDTESHVVTAGSTTVTITADTPDPSVTGQAVQVAYTVAGQGGTPTGTVTVTVSGESASCSSTVAVGGCTLVLTQAGSKTLTATYSGDGNFDPGSDTEPHTVNKAQTTTTITADDPDPSAVGQAITVSFAVAAVPPGAGTPTGLVSVSDGSVTCTATVAQGSCSLTPVTPGNKTLTATYPGDSDFQASSDTEPHVVQQATTTITITADNPDPSVAGQPVTVEWQVTSGTATTPTGTVTVTVNDPSGDNCTGSVQSQQCTITLTQAGSKVLTASYSGDGNNQPASTTAPHQVNRAATQTTLTSDVPDPSVVGQPVTVTFTVTAVAPGAGTPTGTVTVSDGTVNCSASVAQGNCTLVPTMASANPLTATYSGDSNFQGGSGTRAHTTNRAQTTTLITSDDPDPSVVGQPLTVNFSVTVNSPGAGTPGGNVTVSDGTGASCSAPVAQGSCTLTPTTAGAKTLTATYAGDSNFQGSQDTESHTVNQAQTTTAITSDNPDPSIVGQNVTVAFSVSVTAPGSGTPTGTVTVTVDDGTGVSCSASVAAGSCTLAFTTTGAKNLTATYAGDTDFAGSASAAEPHQVN